MERKACGEKSVYANELREREQAVAKKVEHKCLGHRSVVKTFTNHYANVICCITAT